MNCEKNFNNFTQDIPTLCSDPTLPTTAAIRGVLPKIDPAVGGSTLANQLATTSLTTPFDATGKSIADIFTANGFSNFTTQDSAGNTGTAATAASNTTAASSAASDAATTAAAASSTTSAAATDDDSCAAEVETTTAEAVAAATTAATGTTSVAASTTTDAAATDDDVCSAEAETTTAEAVAAATTAATVASSGAASADDDACSAAVETTTAGAETTTSASVAAATTLATVTTSAAASTTASSSDATSTVGSISNTQSTIAGLDFGTCNPGMIFESGLDNRPATEFTFQAADAQIQAVQEEALNHNIITNRICDSLTNFCGSNQAAKSACAAAQTAVTSLPNIRSTADTWNTMLGFAGQNTNPGDTSTVGEPTS